MGGVSVVEVLAVTFHTLAAVMILGVLGAFFAIFTRFSLVAAAAAWAWAMPAFILSPIAYALLTGDRWGFAHVSPLFGPASNGPAALLPPLVLLPCFLVVMGVGGPMFSLAASRADIRRIYSSSAWNLWTWLVSLGALAAVSSVVIPLASVACWSLRVATRWGGTVLIRPWLDPLLLIPPQAALLCLVSAAMAVATWAFLRMAVDLVLTVDQVLVAVPRLRLRKRRASPEVPAIWRNPVAWRETRLRTWGAVGGPAIAVWAALALLFAESFTWALPGVLAGVALLHAAAAFVLGIWLAVRSVESEVREGTFDLVRASTLPGRTIVAGKISAAALPGLPLLIVALPILLVGLPYATILLGMGFGEAVARAIATCVWILPAWLLMIELSMAIALAVREPRAAYGAGFGAFAAIILLPALGSWVFEQVSWISLPLATLVPVLARSARWWQFLVSTAAATILAAALFVWLSLRIRRPAHDR
jgi:hypothetical protein